MKHLEEAIRGIAGTTGAQDVLQGLLRGLREAAPRGALYLVRPDGISGWSSFGYPSDVALAQRSFATPREEGWLGAMAQEPPRGVISIQGHGGPPARAGAEAAETMAAAVCIQDKVVALAVGQRATGEEPWCPYTLGTLVVTVQLRLELSLAERRATSTEPSRSIVPAPTSVALGSAETGTASPAPDSLERLAETTSPSLAAARRFARLVATDIKLYNEQDVVLGRRDGNLVDRLRVSLDRGRESFLERHGDLGEDGLRVLHDAYVQVLAGGEANLLATLDPSTN